MEEQRRNQSYQLLSDSDDEEEVVPAKVCVRQYQLAYYGNPESKSGNANKPLELPMLILVV